MHACFRQVCATRVVVPSKARSDSLTISLNAACTSKEGNPCHLRRHTQTWLTDRARSSLTTRSGKETSLYFPGGNTSPRPALLVYSVHDDFVVNSVFTEGGLSWALPWLSSERLLGLRELPDAGEAQQFLCGPDEARRLVQSKNCERGWNNPADRIRELGPAILAGVETDMAIIGG